jgi:pyruvate/2-oxoglutarate dehydrogenase complex dihydrolipoamide acyltransferase (E2) component
VKITLKLPRVGMTMQTATISEWFKKPGDSIAEGEALYAIETEKVNQEVSAPGSGTLLEVIAKPGEDVEVGASVCVIDVTA